MIERDLELQAISDALTDARAGDGRLVLFEGPAGIGKTSLLEAAREPAGQAGMTVLIGRAGELESNFPYGLVRQLLETPVRTADANRRERLLSDAAALAAPTLLGAGNSPTDATPDATFGVLHGLYWLVANLAAEAPLLLLVDDVQWADSPSVRFLLHLARRLDGLPAAVIGSVRTGESGPQQDLIAALRLSPGAVIAAPNALSEEGVANLLNEAFGREPEPGFTSACHAVTSGNPFYVRELATALIADGTEPEDTASRRVEQAAPKTIASSTLVRLGHMSKDAVDLAQAIAILGPDAGLPRAAALAGLDETSAPTALDALIDAHVIVSSDHQLTFRHPIVRTAIYDELSSGARSTAHGLAAQQLASEGAELDAVAGHLLLTEPIGSTSTISTLRKAAAHALTVGAPDAAATYLTRAVAEGPDAELRTDLVLELGIAKKLARRPDALAHLEEVSRTANDPLIRARALLEQTSMIVFQGRWEEPKELIDKAISELGDRDPATRARAEAVRAALIAFDPRMVAEFDQSLPALRALARDGDASTRPLALLLAGLCVQRGDDRGEILELVDHGWDGGRYVTDGESEELLPQCLAALIALDELDRAAAVTEAVQTVATETGSVLHHLIASVNRAWIESRRGNLTLSAAEIRGCFELTTELGLTFGLATVVFNGLDVLLERPDQADLVQVTEAVELGPLSELTAGALLYVARGPLRFAAGDRDGAIDDMRRAGKIFTAEDFTNPNGYATWRSRLAMMLPPEQRDEALALATSELEDAKQVDQPRGIGVALRALASLEPDPDRSRALHEEAVETLKRSPSKLEQARASVELGSHLRRHGERAAARAPLREGLDLASHGGAIRLAEQARAELAAAGARPRTEFTTGRDALTPSELRVALMASEGRTSREIAQALFVTTRTVDAHLSHCYMKLGIKSRRELAAALGEP